MKTPARNHSFTSGKHLSKLLAFDRNPRFLPALLFSVLVCVGLKPPVATAQCEPAPTGVVSWWRGENNATDQLGLNAGTLQNGVSFLPGKVGNAFSFDGIDDYVSVPHSDDFNPTGPFSVELWIKALPSLLGGYFLIMDKSHGGIDSAGWVIQGDPAGRLVFGYPLAFVQGTAIVTDDQWHHVAGVYTGTQLALYLDGALHATEPLGALPPNNTRDVMIGRWFQGGRHFAGLIDEPAYYNRALSTTEVQAIYSAGTAGKCVALCDSPSIITQPSVQAVCSGVVGTFTVVASGTAPFTYQWLKDGEELSGETADTLTIVGVSSSDAGGYSVRVSNACGQQSSTAAQLLVDSSILLSQGKPVTGSEYFNSGSEVFPYDNLTDGRYDDTGSAFDWSFWLTPNYSGGWAQIDLGSVYQVDTLKVQNTHNRDYNDRGTAEFSIEISTNGVDYLPVVVGTLPEATGLNPIPLETFPVPLQPARFIRFNVLSFYGSGGGLNEMEVYGLACDAPECIVPAILVNPVSQAVCPGTSVNFTVQASGSEPLDYQWFKDGEELDGQTAATLALPAVQVGDIGNYTVRVANACGNVESSVAQLTLVDNPPVVTRTGAASITLEACAATYTELGATATDDCISPIAAITGGDTVNTSVPGTYIVTYTATDSSGQTDTDIRTVIVQDTTPPLLADVPENLTVACSAADKEIKIQDWLATVTATDTCGSVTVANDFGPLEECDSGPRTVTWTATDANGNAATVSRALTITPEGLLTGVQFTDPSLDLTLTANGIHTVNVTVLNTGDCPAVIQSAAFAANFDSPGLSVMSPTFPATVCPGESLQLTLAINTVDALEGDYDATLSLEGPDGGSLSLPIQLLISGQLLPDLTANYSGGGVSVTPSSPAAGQSFTINATVKNIGTAAADGFTVKFFEGAHLLGSAEVAGLAINASTTVQLPVPAGLPDGWHLIRVEVMPPESGELRLKNNAASAVVQVGTPTATTVAVRLTGSVTPNCELSAATLSVRAEYVFVAGGTVFSFPMQGAAVDASILTTELGVTGVYTDVNGNLTTSIGLPAAGDYLVGVAVTDSSITSQDNLGLLVPATPDCVQGGDENSTGSSDSGYGGSGGGAGAGPILDLFVCSGDIFFSDASGLLPDGLATPGTTVQLCANVHFFSDPIQALEGQEVRFSVRRQGAGIDEQVFSTTKLINFSGGGPGTSCAEWAVPADAAGIYSVRVTLAPNVAQQTANDQATRALIVGNQVAPHEKLQVVVPDYGGCNAAGLWVSGRATYVGPTLAVNCGQVSVTVNGFGTDPDNTVELSTATRGGFKTDAAGNFSFQTDIALPTGRNEVAVTVTDGTLTRTTTFPIDCAPPGVSDATQRDLFLYAEHIAFLGDNCLTPLTRNPLPGETISVNAAVQYWDNNTGTLLNADVPVRVNVLVPIGNQLVATTVGETTAGFDGTAVELVCVAWTPTVSGPQVIQVVIDPEAELPFTENRGNNFATRLFQVGQLDCLLTAIPQSAQVEAGQLANYGLIGEKLGDLSPTLNLTVIPDTPDFPLGVSATLGANQMTLPDETTLTLTTTAATPPGTYFFNVIGTGDNCAVLARVKLIVVDNPPPPDTTPPQITCPPAVTVQCDADVPGADVGSVTVSDDADPSPSVIHVGDVESGGSPKTILRTYRATDAANNVAECTQSITVQDTTSPIVTPDGAAVMTVECHGTFVDPGATALDNCAGDLTEDIEVSGFVNVNAPGQYALTYTASDPAGNTASATRTVNVVDTTPPIITCPQPFSIGADASCQAVMPDLTPDAVISDACTPAANLTVTQQPAAGSAIGLGDHTVTLIATDATGNAASCSTTVTVVDETKPQITCPGPLQLEANANCEALVPDLASQAQTSDCGGPVTVVQSPAPGSAIGLGATSVVLTAMDAAGNSESCTVAVTVEDNTPPEFACPAAVQLQADANGEALAPDLGSQISATDCSGPVIVTQSPTAGTLLPAGVNQILITATDTRGNQATCTVAVTVTTGANTPPIVTILLPTSGQLAPIDQAVLFAGSFTDDGSAGTHTAQWILTSANQPATVIPGDVSGGSVSNLIQFPSAGIYAIKLVVTDAEGLAGEATTVTNDLPAYVVVYDPNGGFVTGGGHILSPVGALHTELDEPNPVVGKAIFGFVSKYKRGAQVPTGQTEFQFQAGDLNFHSATYQWLVVSGARAQYKGSGTINGTGNYEFILTAIDGQQTGGGDQDRFRIKIWDQLTGIIIYDNQRGTGDDAQLSSLTAVQSGSIVIHKR